MLSTTKRQDMSILTLVSLSPCAKDVEELLCSLNRHEDEDDLVRIM